MPIVRRPEVPPRVILVLVCMLLYGLAFSSAAVSSAVAQATTGTIQITRLGALTAGQPIATGVAVGESMWSAGIVANTSNQLAQIS